MHLRSTLTLALLSGAAALSHELLWTRRLIDLMGATGEATSRVFGCFFLGLAIGSLLAARALPKVSSPWRAIAFCELAIAVLAVPALTLPLWTDWVWPTLGPERLVGWQGSAIKTLLSVAIVLPPAIPMGMTLPFFAAALLRGAGTLSRQGVLLYGVNTLGGVLGLLATSLVLLTNLGVVGSMAAVAGVNVVIGACAWAFHRSWQSTTAPATAKPSAKQPRQKREVASESPLQRGPAMLLSFVSGLGMLALEVLAIRLLGLVVPSSLQATVAVLVAVILLLAVAAMVFPLLLRIHRSPRNWLLFTLAGAAATSSLTPWLLYRGSGELSQVALPGGAPPTTSAGFMLAVCWLGLTTTGPAILLGGMVLPTLFGWAGGDQGDRRGEGLGYLLAANGVGGLLGAELTGLAILPAVGIHGGFAAVAVLYVLAALVVLRPWAQPKPTTIVLSALIAVAPFGLWRAFSAGVPYLNPRVAESLSYDRNTMRFGRDGVLLAVEHEDKGTGILLNNQYLLNDLGFSRYERREVLLPMLLHPQPERVLCVGLATGISAGAALDYHLPCELTAVEISPMVKAAAVEHFGEDNGHLADQDNVRLVVEDGRTYVASTVDRFDVIVGDLYRPYGAGEGRLYSVEHFRAARRALRGGGLFCQWLPMYQMTEKHFEIIVASFLQAFPEGELIRANRDAESPILGLVGTKDQPLDLTGLGAQVTALKAAGRVTDAELLSPTKVRDFYVGRLDPERFRDTPHNTLNNALVELLAGQRRVTQQASSADNANHVPYLKGKAWKAFEQKLPQLVID